MAGAEEEWSEASSSTADSRAAESSDGELVELDYAEVAARRAREQRVYQEQAAAAAAGLTRMDAPSPPPAGSLRQTWTQRADPYSMMPRRYLLDGLSAAAGEGSAPPAAGGPAQAAAAASLAAACAAAAAPAPPPAPPPAAAAAAPAPESPVDKPALSGSDENFHPSMLCRMLEGDLAKDEEGGDWWMGSADAKFDKAQEILQRMVDSDKRFLRVQREFRDKHCSVFSEEEENKLEYTHVFQQWVEVMERYVRTKLERSIPGFEMPEFLEILEERAEEVSGEVWDLLLSLTDFGFFKLTMLEHKMRVGEEDEETDEELEEYIAEAEKLIGRARRAAELEAAQHRRELADAAVAAGTAAARREAAAATEAAGPAAGGGGAEAAAAAFDGDAAAPPGGAPLRGALRPRPRT
eukprot:TRINITY_DN22853_c0_g4_i1.p1 TRINITY_DN22853_c0_g4~~TRINITY_DN22853_c0_g4_i1.p1  ORF type:complete len:438 (+),score=159.72 TRINITY_DN22853_c0_g4_i1:89-1315(+)